MERVIMTGRKPFLKNRTFGIEVEFSSEQTSVCRMLTKGGLRFAYVESTSRSFGEEWELKPDLTTKCELTTPKMILDDENFVLFKKVLDYLVYRDVKITNKDGVHVHFHVPDISPEKLFISWIYLEQAIVQLFPLYRTKRKQGRVNYNKCYIKKPVNNKITSKYLNRMTIDDTTEHHATMSLYGYKSYKTVEFRLHEGSVDYDNIRNWVKFCLYFLKFAQTTNILELLASVPIDDPFVLNYILKLPTYLYKWIQDREWKYKMEHKTN